MAATMIHSADIPLQRKIVGVLLLIEGASTNVSTAHCHCHRRTAPRRSADREQTDIRRTRVGSKRQKSQHLAGGIVKLRQQMLFQHITSGTVAGFYPFS